MNKQPLPQQRGKLHRLIILCIGLAPVCAITGAISLIINSPVWDTLGLPLQLSILSSVWNNLFSLLGYISPPSIPEAVDLVLGTGRSYPISLFVFIFLLHAWQWLTQKGSVAGLNISYYVYHSYRKGADDLVARLEEKSSSSLSLAHFLQDSLVETLEKAMSSGEISSFETRVSNIVNELDTIARKEFGISFDKLCPHLNIKKGTPKFQDNDLMDMGAEANHAYLAAVRKLILEYYNEEELRTLCFDLGIVYEDLPAKGRAAKARELVSRLNRNGQMDNLRQKVTIERPNAKWPERKSLDLGGN